MRNFNDWLSTMRDSIATWKYYTDFEKVYRNVDDIKIELNILNSLIGSKNIETDFKNILTDYPKTLKVIPILLAKREMEIKIKDAEKEYLFNFKKMNYTIDEYSKFYSNPKKEDYPMHQQQNQQLHQLTKLYRHLLLLLFYESVK